MVISEEKAKLFFEKGMCVHIFDDGDGEHSFYDSERTMPIPVKWKKTLDESEDYLLCVGAATWEEVLESYSKLGQKITRFEVNAVVSKFNQNK